jgi:hypothetical protein
MYHIENGYIKDFESLTEAANYMGCSKETIRQSIKEERDIICQSKRLTFCKC